MLRGISLTVDILQKEQSFALPLLLEASAGTGKTFFIAHFVVRSLLEGIGLDQIAAITFTVKAASELKERIFSLIDEVIVSLIQKDAKFEYLEPYLEDPVLYQKGLDRLIVAKGILPQAIGTIHHFASILLKEHSFKTFTISPNLIEPFARIAQEILEETSPAPHFTFLLTLSQKREKGWDKWIKAVFEQECEKAPGAYLHFVSEHAQKIVQKGSSYLDVFLEDAIEGGSLVASWMTQYKGSKILLEKSSSFAKDLCKVLQGDLFLPHLLNLYPELLELEEKKKKITFLTNSPLQSFLDDVFLPYFFQISQRDFVLNLFKEMILPRWQEYKETKQLVGFDDLLVEVNKLIQEDAYQERIQAAYPLLIVDEFQDTDPLQWSILSQLHLSEKWLSKKRNGGLLLVGDPKQSIYGFRKADLHTYLEAANHSMLTKLTLTCNFRSAPILLNTLNLLFHSDHSHSWSWIPQKKAWIDVPTLEAKSLKTIPTHLGAAVEIAICERATSRERNFPGAIWEKTVAFPYIIEEIQKLHGSGIPLREICILIEDRYQGFRLKAVLDQASIPANIDRSFDVRENSELFALAKLLFQAIENPDNSSRAHSLLLSPLFQVDPQEEKKVLSQAQSTLKSLNRLLFQERGLFFARLLKDPLFQGGRTLEEGIFHLDHLLYEGATRGFWILLEKLITSDVEKRGESAFEQLLDQWQASLGSQDGWTLPKTNGSDAVQLMTCFAAKGLEFDVVFALNLASRDADHEDVRDEECIAEKMRQLYVAMTRSKLKLYLLLPLETTPVLRALIPSPLELFFAQMLEGTIDLEQAIEKAKTLSFEKIQKAVSLLSSEGASINLKKIDSTSFEPVEQEEFESIHSPEETLSSSIQASSIQDPFLLYDPLCFETIEPIEEASFTSLRHITHRNQERFLEASQEVAVSSFPSGKEIGDLIHKLFDQLFSKGLFRASKREERNQFILGFLHSTPLAKHVGTLIERVDWWFHTPLFDAQAIEDLLPDQVQSEMDFIFTLSQENQQESSMPDLILRGSIDLCVIIGNRIWILDWKTHLLDRNTSQEQLRDLVIEEGYDLQAKIYALGLQEWLSLFREPLQLQAVLFCFLHCNAPLAVEIPLDQKNALEQELLLIGAKHGGGFE